MLPGGVLSDIGVPAPWVNPYWRLRVYPLVDYEYGGIALNDGSRGLHYQEWTCWYDTEAQIIYLAPSSTMVGIPILTDLPEVEEVTFTFDQNMRPAIAYKQAGVIKFYWYDTSIPGPVTTTYPNAISAIARLDDHRDSQFSNSDIILVTIESGFIYYRMQRERFETIHELKPTTSLGLVQCGMNKKWRFQIQTVDDRPECAEVDGKINVSCIIADQCRRVNVPTETGDLFQTFVPGYLINSQNSVRANIEPLQAMYAFDAFEHDGLVWFRTRGRTPTESYDSQDVAATTSGAEPVDTMSIQRTQETELPKTVNLGYMDIDREHEPSIQSASRTSVNTVNELTINANVVLSADDAKGIVEKMLRTAWLNREVVRFTLPMSEIALRPTDNIVIVADGVSNVIRITSIRYQLAGVLECEGLVESMESVENYGAYSGWTPSSSGVAGNYTPTPLPETPTPIMPIILDVNMVSDYHDDKGIYIGGSTTGYWRGAYVYSSQDGGVTYQFLTALDSQAKTGAATTILAPPIHPGIVDRAHTVRVTMDKTTMELSSISHGSALSHSLNLAILGDEIICYEYALLVSPGVYDLTGLHRGLRGTEWAMSTHNVGDQFVVINSAIVRQTIINSSLFTSIILKFLAYGQSLDAVAPIYHTYAGASLEPYAPCNLRAVDVGGGSWNVTWTRRTRIDGEWRDYVDVALSELEEKYKVEVYNGATLLSSTTVTTPSATVTASAGNKIRVNQISAVTGDGYVSEVTI